MFVGCSLFATCTCTHLNYIMEQCSHVVQIIVGVLCYYMHVCMCVFVHSGSVQTKIKQLSLNNTPILDTYSTTLVVFAT